jgi:NitT/TauT family transport system substrate-binding protein
VVSKKLVAMAMAVAFHATAAAAETVTARVGVIPVIGAAPLFVAEKEGWLREGGLDLQTKVFESGPNIVQAAASGGIDIYVGGVAPAAAGRAKGIDLRVVAALAVDENVLVGGAKLRTFFKKGVAPAAAFKAFRAANGRPAKIATQPPGSVPAANLQYWLREATHTDPADVEIVSIGIDATQQALLANAVEAATVREPTLTIVQKANPEIALIAGGSELFPGQPGTVAAVSKDFLEKHPQQVQALVAGLVRAVEELQKNPDRAAPHVEAALSKGLVDGATIRKSLSSPAVHFVVDPEAITQSTKALLAYQVTLGVVDKAPSVDGLFDSSFFEKTKSGKSSKK